ncbi:Uncharacterized protein Fot_11882 [Forsythia ovata]|uniref:Uncharacterized protein n=1 Tax=Forsythia ovata TaxID=205694 RepID=A0ABD1WLC6_9LAMI
MKPMVFGPLITTASLGSLTLGNVMEAEILKTKEGKFVLQLNADFGGGNTHTAEAFFGWKLGRNPLLKGLKSGEKRVIKLEFGMAKKMKEERLKRGDGNTGLLGSFGIVSSSFHRAL